MDINGTIRAKENIPHMFHVLIVTIKFSFLKVVIMILRKTLKIPIEQKDRFEDLRNVYQKAFESAYSGSGYKDLREEFPEYNSLLVNNAKYDARSFMKLVLETHTYPKKKIEENPLFRKEDIKLDFNEEKGEVIYKPWNRIEFDIYPSEKQLKEIKKNKVKGARLVKKDNFKLHLYLEKNVEIPKWQDCETLIGIDIGLNYLAVCSTLNIKTGNFGNPKFFKGGEWKHLSRRQRKTNSTKWKHLQNRKEEIIHTISKRIIEYAKQFEKPLIVLEKITLRNSKTKNKWNNFLLNTWARRKLQDYIEYKANWEGIPVVYINPYKTSQICCYCGEEGERNGKHFYCSNCGRQLNADFNASVIISKKFRRQILDELPHDDRESFLKGSNTVKEGRTYLPKQTSLDQGTPYQMNRMNTPTSLRGVRDGKIGHKEGRC